MMVMVFAFRPCDFRGNFRGDFRGEQGQSAVGVPFRCGAHLTDLKESSGLVICLHWWLI